MSANIFNLPAVIRIAAAVMTALALAFSPGSPDAEVRDTAAKVSSYPSDLTLLILTDVHYDPGKYQSGTGERDILEPTMDAIRKIRERAGKKGIDAYWNLGDFINGHGTTKAEAIEQIRTVTAAQAGVSADFHNIAGNHDSNIHAVWNNPPQPLSEVLTTEEVNGILENRTSSQTEHHNPAHPTDYYVDFETVRAVCLSAENTAFQQATADWLQSTALDTDKEVLFLSHLPTRPEWGFWNDVTGGEMIEAAVRAFLDRGGTVIAWIHGHDHGDMISAVTDEGGEVLWYEVCIGCARFQYPTSNGTQGMTFRPRNEKDATALLFDVVSIDQTSGTVRFTRFGAGEDRAISYRRCKKTHY